MKKAIITGPTGAIGIALIQELIKHRIFVTAVCHRHSGRISRIPQHELVKVIECDLSELRTLVDLLESNYDVFYHFAWACTIGNSRNNVSAQIENIQYTIDAVEVAKQLGCRTFIGAGSQAEYGRYDGILNSEVATFPENGYGIAKLCAGQLSRIRCEQLGLDHIWTRILSVYGPFDGENTLISSLIKRLLLEERPKCTKGEQVWDYMYSKDAAKALLLLGEKGLSGKIYCLGSGDAKPLSEYITLIRDMIAPGIEIGWGDIPYSTKQVMHLQADITDLIRDTGFKPEYSFENGIAETIRWMKEVFHEND